MNKIVVHVDPELIDLIPRFLTNKRRDSQNIAELITKGDYDSLRGIGHKLKGEGGGYGLDQISAIGLSLEDAAAGHDLGEVRRCYSELVEYLDAVEVVPDQP